MNKNINIELMNNIRLCFNVIKRARLSSDLPHGYGRIMAVICHHDGLTQSELADLLDIRPQSLTRSLADLEENGYITRARLENDHRNVVVLITEKGIEYHKRIEKERQKRADTIFSCLDEQEKETLMKLLQKVITINNQAETGDEA